MTFPVNPRDRMVLDGIEFEVIGEPERFDRSPFGPLSAFPTPFTVGHRVFSAGAIDDYGNPAESWAAPVDRKVHGWSTPRTSEPKLAGHNRDVVEIELLAPECRVINLRKVAG